MLTPWQIWNCAAEAFEKDHYVVVPELDGHTEDEATAFNSVEEEADKICEYIRNELEGKVFLLAELSMGGRIAAEIAKSTDINIQNLVLDGAPLTKMNGLMKSIFKRILFMHGSKGNEAVSRKCALRMKAVNPQTEIREFKGMAHAELACFKPEQWVKEVEGFLS